MKKILFNFLDKSIEVANQLNIFKIESIVLYKKLYFEVDSLVSVNINNQIVDFKSNCLVIHNLYELNINDKKHITQLYKKLENNIDDKTRVILAKIEENAIKVIEELAYKCSFDITFDSELNFSKFLSSYNVRFEEPSNTNYIEILIKYLKLLKEVYKIEFVFTFGLNDLLEENEISELNYQLSCLDITIIDIKFERKNIKEKFVIDTDWCII